MLNGFSFVPIDKMNVRFFVPICPAAYRQRLLMNAFQYPAGLNGIGAVNKNTKAVGLIYTLRNPDSDDEYLRAFNSLIPPPDGLEILKRLLRQLIEQAVKRSSKTITASFFEPFNKTNKNETADNLLLKELFAEAGFEEPKPVKVNYKLNTVLLDKEKYRVLLPEATGVFSFQTFEEFGTFTDEQLPPHPPELTPFIPNTDTKLSLLLLRNGKIAGWCSASRLSSASIFYRTLYADEEAQKAYGSPLLLRQIIAVHLEHDYAPFAIFSGNIENTQFHRILERQFGKYCSSIICELYAVKLL
ncbi:MAG: hypothetical protein LBQ50_12630 [Planctomycetaceae bacterium]|jgi:hypothetical protein|nr:hypothetical protein [Planctomycetaceae bacterium]